MPELGIPPKRHLVRNVLIGVIVLIVIGRFVGTSKSSSNTSQSASLEQAPIAIAIDYSKLYNDYQANPIKADSIYKGKLLKLTGKLAKIDREIFATICYIRD